MSENIDESIRIAHLSMIQGVITRMGSNSFALKALSAALASASVAVMATITHGIYYYLIFAVIPLIIFWLMDAQYLRLEKAYRKLYDAVRKGEEIETYDLSAQQFMGDMKSILKIARSWSVSWFYLAMISALVVVSILISGCR